MAAHGQPKAFPPAIPADASPIMTRRFDFGTRLIAGFFRQFVRKDNAKQRGKMLPCRGQHYEISPKTRRTFRRSSNNLPTNPFSKVIRMAALMYETEKVNRVAFDSVVDVKRERLGPSAEEFMRADMIPAIPLYHLARLSRNSFSEFTRQRP